MAVVLGNLYIALIAAGASEEQATEASEVTSGGQRYFSSIDSKISLMIGMTAFSIVFNFATLLILLTRPT
ncbi:hypothetical protein G3545_29235 [Starkeya sp. ORNL1]|uniref:hypothetical protein n=1 Tax=Starkeya sp. ORNL1 TaxID=2709380 RepID=UPI001463E8EE|nr:hypothetical protein [Starkeya sp. ORNL1]QJP17367.1 hypothetical protein G3545_29235 [Starkeya sp. ORNL1]